MTVVSIFSAREQIIMRKNTWSHYRLWVVSFFEFFSNVIDLHLCQNITVRLCLKKRKNSCVCLCLSQNVKNNHHDLQQRSTEQWRGLSSCITAKNQRQQSNQHGAVLKIHRLWRRHSSHSLNHKQSAFTL